MPQRPHGLEVDPGELVEGGALGRRTQKRLVGVLAVEVDEVPTRLLEGGEGRHLAVDLGTGATGTRDRAREDHLVFPLGGGESALDGRLVRTTAHHRGVDAPADEELERLDDERLARAGLPGDCRHAGAEDDVHVLNDPQLADAQFAEHGRG